MQKQKRIRLNAEIRNRLAIQFKNHLENESTQEKEAFLQSREQYPLMEKTAFETARQIVSRVYPKEDVEKAKYLSDKFENIDIYRKDRCFNFSFTTEVEERRYNSHTNQNETIKVVKPQDKHFDFGLRGSTTGCSYDNQSHFAFAMYREELKAQPNCNPDIMIEQESDSPYKRKFVDANDKFFGFANPKNENCILHNYAKNFELEVLGSNYCSSRLLKADNTEIEVLEKNIEQNLNKILHKDKEQNVLNTLTSDLLLLSKSISKIEKEINSIEKLSTCFVCSQDVDDEVKEKLKLTKIQELDKQNKDFSTIEESLSKLKEKIKKYDDIQEIVKKDRSELSEAKASIRAIDQQLNDIKVSVTDIAQEEIDALKQKMNIYIDQGKELIKEKQEIKDNLHYYKIALYLLKDSGIKSKIIKHYLPIMNKVINRYLSEMNFFVQFELDEEFKETIKSRNRDIFSYENFSEGEKRKIDLALLFAWRKISQVKNSLNCNLLIFDEILDGSLDDNATKLLLSILEMIDNDSNIFVISHKSKDILQDKFENNIMFKKKKNFSKISHD